MYMSMDSSTQSLHRLISRSVSAANKEKMGWSLGKAIGEERTERGLIISRLFSSASVRYVVKAASFHFGGRSALPIAVLPAPRAKPILLLLQASSRASITRSISSF